MKAVVHNKYGGPEVLEIEEAPKPIPSENEILVRVHATSVNPSEWYGMTGLFLARLGNGLFNPKETSLGADFAGVVEAAGSAVSDFKQGDEVFGGRHGAFAEYVTVSKGIAHKPDNISLEEAAASPIAGITALQGLRDHGKIGPGQKVLINGASGGVGTFAVQIAKAFGAEVTAVCSTGKVEQTRALGVDHVIDYKKQDFTRSGEKFDLVFDVAGSRSFFALKRVLKPGARVVVAGGPRTPVIGPLGHIMGMLLGSKGSGHKVTFFIAKFTREDFKVLADLMESGKVKPVVQEVFPLAKIAEAMRCLGTGHARGKLVVQMR